MKILFSDALLGTSVDAMAAAIIGLSGDELRAEALRQTRDRADWIRSVVPDADEGDIQITARAVTMMATVRARDEGAPA